MRYTGRLAKNSKKRRFLMAMVCYAVLALLAAVTLQGPFRIAVWLFVALFAVLTSTAAARQD